MWHGQKCGLERLSAIGYINYMMITENTQQSPTTPTVKVPSKTVWFTILRNVKGKPINELQ